jgi:hypothetical protein
MTLSEKIVRTFRRRVTAQEVAFAAYQDAVACLGKGNVRWTQDDVARTFTVRIPCMNGHDRLEIFAYGEEN